MARTKREEALRRSIKSGMALKDYGNPEMATRMHMSVSSWERRLREPRLLRYPELCDLERILSIRILA